MGLALQCPGTGRFPGGGWVWEAAEMAWWLLGIVGRSGGSWVSWQTKNLCPAITGAFKLAPPGEETMRSAAPLPSIEQKFGIALSRTVSDL